MNNVVIKLTKRFLIFVLIIILSLDTFAAVVGDNDGSAFITKAEFDSLKNNFQSQIDNYNTGIDNKIDGAIASYLAGINITKTKTSSIINVDWKDVTFINGYLNNTFEIPDVDLLLSQMSMHDDVKDMHPTSAQYFYYIVSHFSRVKYKKDWNIIHNVYRNIVNSDKAYGEGGKLIWGGQALRYNESFKISRAIPNWPRAAQQWAYLDRPDADEFKIEITNFYTLVGVGDVTDWDSKKTTAWPFSYKWYWRAKGSTGSYSNRTIEFTEDLLWDNAVLNVTLDADDTGETTRYNHIVEHNRFESWEVFNPNWVNLLNTSLNSNIKANDLKTAATTTSKARSMGYAEHVVVSGDHPAGLSDINVEQVTSNNDTLPSIGLLESSQLSDSIYQDNIDRNIDVAGTTIRKVSPKLSEGFQLLAAKKDDKVEWEPEFSLTHVHNGAGTYAPDNSHEVDIYFSNGPFTNMTTTSNLIKVKIGTETIERDYATTTNRKCKIKFTMPEDGLVYVKCIPHNAGIYLNSDWMITLDVSNCNSYKYERD